MRKLFYAISVAFMLFAFNTFAQEPIQLVPAPAETVSVEELLPFITAIHRCPNYRTLCQLPDGRVININTGKIESGQQTTRETVRKMQEKINE